MPVQWQTDLFGSRFLFLLYLWYLYQRVFTWSQYDDQLSTLFPWVCFPKRSLTVLNLVSCLIVFDQWHIVWSWCQLKRGLWENSGITLILGVICETCTIILPCFCPPVITLLWIVFVWFLFGGFVSCVSLDEWILIDIPFSVSPSNHS